MKQPTLFDLEDGFVGRKTKDVTFKGKLDLPIHRWYRLTPSFSPQLAMDIADHFGLSGHDRVLDPFSGVGTVPLCMKYRGIPACSIELNPYLHFVSTVKTRTYRDLSGIRRGFESFLKSARSETRLLSHLENARAYLSDHARYIPRINHIERWWSECNLAQLVALRKRIMELPPEPEFTDLLRMATLAILIPASNAKHNHVSLTFAEEPLPPIDVAGLLADKSEEICADIESVADKPGAEVLVFRGNSKFASKVLPEDLRFTAVITSPPYPNRFSYARETRPHMFFFDFIESAGAVGELETEAIGGTWGRATSVLAKGVQPANEVVAGALKPFVPNIGQAGELMASYVVKYFNDIYTHAAQIAKVCDRRARLAYVIGNSKFYGNPLPSDEILAALFKHFGFELEGIQKMRRRQSKEGLYEAVVFMSRH